MTDYGHPITFGLSLYPSVDQLTETRQLAQAGCRRPRQLRLEPADLRRYAERLDLDLERFEADISDPAIKARVERDVESGEQSGVDGTPSLFIDRLRYRGPRDTDSLGNALGRQRPDPTPLSGAPDQG